MNGMRDSDILMERKFGKDPEFGMSSRRACCGHQGKGVGELEDREDTGLLEIW